MRGWAFLTAIAVVGAGCVSPQENAAEAIVDVPYDLLGPTSTTTEPPPDDAEGQFELELFFLAEDDALWRVVRAREQRPGPQDALDALVIGPTEAESEFVPIRSRLSETLNPIAGQPIGGLLSITVDDEAQFRDNPNNRLTTQVLVCAMTQFSSVDSVEIRDTSGPIPLSGIDSESIGERATRASYDDCAAAEVADLPLEPLDPASANPDEADGESAEETDG